ncbi:MAG: DUF642 domain-containing protein [Lewinellaceae bacterium]|nr:DUF642 domain-containing protein [Lewinellaceae bacterium]
MKQIAARSTLGIALLVFFLGKNEVLRAQPACVPTNCCCGGVVEIGVPNGNFEGPPFAPLNNFITFFAGESFSSWTVQGGSIDLLGPNTPGFANGNPNGPSQHIDLNGFTNGTITTTLTGMTAGYSYTIVLWYAKNPGTPVANCNIRVAGGSWLNQTWSSTNNGGDIWLERCFMFTAQAATAELRFIGSSGVAVAGMLLDDITMWECPTDTQAPTVANPPPSPLTVSCPSLVPPPAQLTVFDNCAQNPTVTYSEDITPQNCYFSVLRIWEVTDACNNTTTVQQNIQVLDNQAPFFLTLPGNSTVSCGNNTEQAYNNWLQTYGGGIAADNCTQNLTWTVTPLIPFSETCGMYPVTFTVQDECFNTVTRTVLFTIVDNLPPTLLQPAVDKTLFCPVNPADSLAAWLANQGGAQVIDPCGPVVWTNNFSGNFNDPVVEVTFTATDLCANSVATTAIFTQVTTLDSIFVDSTTCDPQMAGVTFLTFSQGACELVFVTTTTLLPSDSVGISAATCDSAQVGVFVQNLTNQFGCDSIVTTTITLLPSDSVRISVTTCDSAQVGVFVQNLTNQFGCDSIVTTTVVFDPAATDTTVLAQSTCDPAQAGILVQNLTNQFGCDSIVTTTTTLLPSDFVSISATTCDPAMVGVTVQNLTNQFGCDSIVTTTTTLLPSDFVNLAATTCDPAQVGVLVQNLINQFGCDSIVATTTTLLPSDFVNLATTTCDPAQVGVFVQNLINQFGCDSIVATTTTLLPSDFVNLTATTCDPAQVGVLVQNLTNQFGCDSIVTTTTTLLPSDFVNLSATTCDPAQVGVFVQNLTNQFGCDSIVTTTTTLLPSSFVNLAATTCDPAQVGVLVQNLTNQFGCDSIVTTTTTLLPSDFVNLAATTCDPAQVGVLVQNLTNQFGCDSIVTTTTTLLPSDFANLSATTCDPRPAGGVQNLTNQFGCDSIVTTPPCPATVSIAATTCDPAQAGFRAKFDQPVRLRFHRDYHDLALAQRPRAPCRHHLRPRAGGRFGAKFDQPVRLRFHRDHHHDALAQQRREHCRHHLRPRRGWRFGAKFDQPVWLRFHRGHHDLA